MPSTLLGFSVPTLGEVVERVLDDLNANLPGEDARIQRSEPFAFGTAVGGAVKGLYGFVRFLARQILPDRATGDYLVRHATIWGIFRQLPTFSSGEIRATGNVGTTIHDGTVWQLLDGSVQYQQVGDQVVGGGGFVDVPVFALVEGEAGDAVAATLVTLADEIAGIDSDGVVQTDIDGGNPLEDDDSLRERVVDKIRKRPQGGADADYEAWIKASGPVDRVFVTPNEFGNGTVGLRFVMTVEAGGVSDDAVPSGGDVTNAENAVAAQKPVTADAQVVALSAESHTFDISLVPNDSQTQSNVTAEINGLFLRAAVPGGTISLGELRGAIDSAAGEDSHVVNLIDGFAPVEDAIPIGADGWPTISLPITWS